MRQPFIKHCPTHVCTRQSLRVLRRFLTLIPQSHCEEKPVAFKLRLAEQNAQLADKDAKLADNAAEIAKLKKMLSEAGFQA